MERPDDFLLTEHGCTCFQGHPPCSYCTDTFTCESCTDRALSNEADEGTEFGFICENCLEFYEAKCYDLSRLKLVGEDMILFILLLAYMATLNDIMMKFIIPM